MAYNQLITKNGHSLFTMSSLYQDFMREEEADLQYKQLSFFDLEGIKGNFSYA